jgi:hypothetical protein
MARGNNGGMGIGLNKGSTTSNKRTSQGRGNIKSSSMNKSKRASFKKYRGQGT